MPVKMEELEEMSLNDLYDLIIDLDNYNLDLNEELERLKTANKKRDAAGTLELKPIEVIEMHRKRVSASGNSGRVYVPPHLIGEEVIIILPKENRE